MYVCAASAAEARRGRNRLEVGEHSANRLAAPRRLMIATPEFRTAGDIRSETT